ncbi:MAG: hypothetical protein NC434_12365 [Ruminococcus sp.]|nr:hypothetical protein [Ruminococcus sp.]
MRNKYILLEMNQRNEIRADVNMTIKSMELTEIENMNVKIDTGCPCTSIPILRFGISNVKAQKMKQRDCGDDRIRKEISFGVNDSKEKRDADKEKFKTGKYMELKSITFQHGGFEIDFGGVCINQDYVKVSYDRTGNILIGMDILSQMDIHIGRSKILGKTVFIACPYNSMNREYFEALNWHFTI